MFTQGSPLPRSERHPLPDSSGHYRTQDHFVHDPYTPLPPRHLYASPIYAHPDDHYSNVRAATYNDDEFQPNSIFNGIYDRRPLDSAELPMLPSIPYHPHARSAVSQSGIPNLAPLKRNDTLGDPSAFAMGSTQVNFLPETLQVSSSENSVDSELWPAKRLEVVGIPPQPDTKLRPKARREKPRLELAADQPPTTQGKPRARVYVACQQCRSRKIRCDGAKPACHNCCRRTMRDECYYDPVPKRRGPDKTPGARQRTSREPDQERATSVTLASMSHDVASER